MSTRTGVASIAPETQSLVDRASHAVRQAILMGRLRPGEMLSISDLAADLGTSHGPVREALQRLSGQGLVVLRPARSAIVAPLDLDDLREIYMLREALEIGAAAKAASALTSEDLETVEHHFEELIDAEIDTDAFWEAHNAFHRTLMAPVLTPRLERIITELWDAAERYIRIVYSETDVLFRHTPRERHEPLLEAARSGKSTAMRKAIAAHLTNNETEIARTLKQLSAAADDGRAVSARSIVTGR